MLGVVGHHDCLVDEKHRDAVLDAVRAAKSGVVEALIVDQQQRPAVFRADEDAEELFVEHDRPLAGRTKEDADTRGGAGIRRQARRQHRTHARWRLADAEVVPKLQRSEEHTSELQSR